MRRLAALAVSALAACADDPVSSPDAAVFADAAAPSPDGGAGGFDARASDDAGAAPPCTVLDLPADPARAAAASGHIQILDYDFWDAARSARIRVRNDATNFLTQPIPPSPISDGALFRGVPPDTCVVFEQAVPNTPLGPSRNIGTRLVMEDGLGATRTRTRASDQDGVHYRTFASAEEQRLYFDPQQTPLSRAWTYSTPGDPAARIAPARAEVGPVEDFEVTPALTATSSPVRVDPAGFLVRWTAPATTAADVAVVLGKALNPQGDARYVLCRPIDDGEFVVPAASIAALEPTPGLAFGVSVSRGAVAPFCNEGVPAGVAHHVLAYLGTGVVP